MLTTRSRVGIKIRSYTSVNDMMYRADGGKETER